MTAILEDALAQATVVYLHRQQRLAHPRGGFDKGGRWSPAGEEIQPCCSTIRYPSRAYPYSLLVHCRTARHVANLYGVDERALWRAVKEVTA